MSSAIKQTSHVRASAFRAALAAGCSPFRLGQQELFSSEEERHIQLEVGRKLYEPKLPNAGAQERKWVELLREFSRDEKLVVNVKIACRMYADALAACLPAQEYIPHPKPDSGRKWLTLPGCYYTRKGVITAKTNKGLYEALLDLKAEAQRVKNRNLRWLADFLMAGMPAAVSNFKMECLYLLRGADGNVTRLVRLVNTKGEMSEGREIGGADMLPNELYAGSEKFRQWVQSKGNFAWGGDAGAGNTELQAMQWDVTEDAAYRTVKLIEYCGWHEIKKAGGGQPARGIWFYNGCAIDGKGGPWLLPDADGIIWHEGLGYATSSKGRELDFAHGRPTMLLKRGEDNQAVVLPFEPDKSEWQPESHEIHGGGKSREALLGGFFREVCRRFYDTAGGPGGLMAVASVLGYAVGPEFFEQLGCLPSTFIPGEMGSGKTFFSNWLMGFQGYAPTKGLGLGKGSFVTVPGLCAQLENYSSLAVWFDEYREHEITPEKIAVIRAAYDRQLANKWTPDGVQRVIRTTPLISGETTTSDPATHSRYMQLQLSRQDRLADHLTWLRDNRGDFVRFWMYIMENRPLFIEMVMKNVAGWFTSKATENMPERSRATYALAYGTFMALVGIFESHTLTEIESFKQFLISRASVSAADVDHDKFSNVFVQEMLTAYKAGAISDGLFRVEYGPWERDELGYPWRRTVLFMEPYGVIDSVLIHLRKANRSLALKYKDLRDQLSKNNWWVRPENPKNPIKKRFGNVGSRSNDLAWGIDLEFHPLGRQPTTLEEMKGVVNETAPPLESMIVGDIRLNKGEADPRKGPLFAIVEGVAKWEKGEE